MFLYLTALTFQNANMCVFGFVFLKSCDLFIFIINNTVVVYGFASMCYIKDVRNK